MITNLKTEKEKYAIAQYLRNKGDVFLQYHTQFQFLSFSMEYILETIQRYSIETHDNLFKSLKIREYCIIRIK